MRFKLKYRWWLNGSTIAPRNLKTMGSITDLFTKITYTLENSSVTSLCSSNDIGQEKRKSEKR